MICPMCGDEIVNGRCRFCGYIPTQEDMAAVERWQKQKASLYNSGRDPASTWKAEKPGWAKEKTKKPKVRIEKRYEPANAKKQPVVQTRVETRRRQPAEEPVKNRVSVFLKIFIAIWIIGFVLSFVLAFYTMFQTM